ncbi:MAG: ChbG/HpnK family deacetylase [Solirubrobacterales bacterium]|nr:ChbG/HpnK family deacetylase [Solirubrobacterales bacterium]
MSVRRLIVNADDFGFAIGVNDGIVEAHVSGIVTSTSLMVGWPAAAHAVELARDHPRLSVGLHYVEDGPEIDEPGHAARTFAAQLARFRELTGSDPTHVDSHHHVHMSRLATFAPLVAPLGVPLRGDGRVRFLSDFYAQPRPGVTELHRVQMPYLLELISHEVEPDGFTELGCHPARVTGDLVSSYTHEREVELATLTDPDVRARIEGSGLALASYRDWRE